MLNILTKEEKMIMFGCINTDRYNVHLVYCRFMTLARLLLISQLTDLGSHLSRTLG